MKNEKSVSKTKSFTRPHFSVYGGTYRNTRAGRLRPRPVSCSHSMHLVMRSTVARGEWSFWAPKNRRKIEIILKRFSNKHSVKILSMANVGNHLHLHIRVIRFAGYKRFIRATTSAIAMAVTGRSRWKPNPKSTKRFWDLRPFTRFVIGSRDFSNMRNYIRINQLEGLGYPRAAARQMAEVERRLLNSE